MAKQNVLITGGAGKLARQMLDELRAQGYERIVLFDRIMPGEGPFPWELKPGEALFVRGDLTNLGDCMRAITLADADVIVHLGALTGPTEMHPNRKFGRGVPEDSTMLGNTMGTYYLMDAARRLKVKKVIFASTFYVLGLGNRLSGTPYIPDYLPIDENHPNRPEDSYGFTKVACEEILAAYSRAYGIRTVAFRLMGISASVRPIDTDMKIPDVPRTEVKGMPGTTLQYSDARDISYAMRLAIEKDLENMHEVFYHASDTCYRGDTAPVVKIMFPDLAGMADNIKGEEGIVSIKKLENLLGYKSQYTWKKDLK